MPDAFHLLADGTELADQALVLLAGAGIAPLIDSACITVRSGFRSFTLTIPAKRVEVSLGDQELQAWQGARLVLRTRISPGRNGSTPAGDFQAGPFKPRIHYSSCYHNALMPWSVQINGHIFIHGFTSVPDYPASHGCIRVPLIGNKPSRCFYEWVDRGTPIRISTARNKFSPNGPLRS
ncbi:MAG: ErfK/YbiS/YcfS/YnhG family protein [Verrucomicrobiales bacterium]|nr:ErfK/YbiS/YcfS/YnhG family protein [Verrucomicrobiales bacterium]